MRFRVKDEPLKTEMSRIFFHSEGGIPVELSIRRVQEAHFFEVPSKQRLLDLWSLRVSKDLMIL